MPGYSGPRKGGLGPWTWMASLPILLLAGCGLFRDPTSLPPDEKAKVIQQHIVSGEELLRNLTLDDSIDITSPEDADRVLDVAQRAREHFEEAARLAPDSSKPILRLSSVLHVIALQENLKYTEAAQQIAALEKLGASVPAALQADSERALEATHESARLSNRKLDYYERYLYASFPNPAIFETMASNHELLGNYEQAAIALERFIRETRLNDDIRARFETRIRIDRERALEAADAGR